jgi:hypothetical protein
MLMVMHLVFICQTFSCLQKRMARHTYGNWPGAIRFNAEVAPLRQTTGNRTERLERPQRRVRMHAAFATGNG